MGTTVPLIKWQYLHYQKDPEERERWFRIIPEIIYQTQLTLLYENYAGQKILKPWFTMVKRETYPASLFGCVKPSRIPAGTATNWKTTNSRNFLPDEMGLFIQ